MKIFDEQIMNNLLNKTIYSVDYACCIHCPFSCNLNELNWACYSSNSRNFLIIRNILFRKFTTRLSHWPVSNMSILKKMDFVPFEISKLFFIQSVEFEVKINLNPKLCIKCVKLDRKFLKMPFLPLFVCHASVNHIKPLPVLSPTPVFPLQRRYESNTW